MSKEKKDLWPSDFGVTDFVTPASILKEQAALLGQKTNNLVEAEVKSGNETGRFVHSLHIVAPALDNYRYFLLKLTHSIELYPVSVFFAVKSATFMANDQNALIELLSACFNDPKTINIVRALIVQSQK